MPMRTAWLAGVVALGCSCSPYGGGSFACSEDTQCAPDGVCSTGFCAFPDPLCDSNFRYGDLSGPNSGQCVGATNPDVDAAVDADETPTPDGSPCYGTSLARPCFAAVPTGNVTLNAAINTTNSTMCAPLVGTNANAWCVIAGSAITVSGTVAVTGNRPLVLVSTGTISVQGTLDVASHRNGNVIGAGADVAGCNAPATPTVTSGGGGGSFGGKGGNGSSTGTNGVGGVAGNTLTPTALRGGCPGGQGAGGSGGAPGRGGGAVWLYAATSITIGGTINASGSSGAAPPAATSSGGGGGGTGGYIGLEAPTIMVTGQVFANGGAGGEGSGQISGGQSGTDSANATTAAVGGNGGSDFAADGGNGSVGTTLTGSPGSAVCTGNCTTPAAGGGGGGGAGIIKVIPSATLGGSVSPPAT